MPEHWTLIIETWWQNAFKLEINSSFDHTEVTVPFDLLVFLAPGLKSTFYASHQASSGIESWKCNTFEP